MCTTCKISACSCPSPVRYEGENIDSLSIKKGDTLEKVIQTISDYVSDIVFEDGEDGVGIESTSYDAGTGKLTITFTNATTFMTGDLRGENGDYIVVTSESPGVNCANGGIKVEVFDGTTATVLTTNFVCNGVDGTNGTNGTNGVDGKTVLNGTSDPTTQGVDGDFFINTTTWTIFGPKTTGSWGSGTSLIGPAGAGSASLVTLEPADRTIALASAHVAIFDPARDTVSLDASSTYRIRASINLDKELDNNTRDIQLSFTLSGAVTSLNYVAKTQLWEFSSPYVLDDSTFANSFVKQATSEVATTITSFAQALDGLTLTYTNMLITIEGSIVTSGAVTVVPKIGLTSGSEPASKILAGSHMEFTKVSYTGWS